MADDQPLPGDADDGELAWLLHRSANILLVPGTSSIEHLRANVAAADRTLTDDVLAELDAL